MKPLFRIAAIGTKGGNRKYISGTPEAIQIVGRTDALHWDKATAKILTEHFNAEFERLDRPERFQIERAS